LVPQFKVQLGCAGDGVGAHFAQHIVGVHGLAFFQVGALQHCAYFYQIESENGLQHIGFCKI
jgi:hypothetical protein